MPEELRPRDYIAQQLPTLDQNLAPTDCSWAPAAFLLASAMMGPDAHAIAAEMEMDEVTVGVFAERARANGIWADGKVRSAPWFDEEMGGASFWMDVSILAGDMMKVGDNYSLTSEGKRRVESLLAR